MAAEGKQAKKKNDSLLFKPESDENADNESTSVQRKKSGKKRKPPPMKETEITSETETSESFKPSTEFSVSSSRKGRVIGKRLPSARPKAGNFVPNKKILDQPFFPGGSPESVEGKRRSPSRSLSPKRKAKSLQTENTLSEQGEKSNAKERKGRGRIRSTSPSRKESHVSLASEGDVSASLSTARKKKKGNSRSKSSSPVRKASNISNASDGSGASSSHLYKRGNLKSQSSSPTRKKSNVSTSDRSASSELWTLPRRKSSVQSHQSVSPARRRSSLGPVIEEIESGGVSTILRKKKKAMVRGQSCSPLRKPKNVMKAVKIGELSPLSAVLKKKTNEIIRSQSLSPIREARTVSKALEGEQSSSIASILKKKKSQMTRSRSTSPVRREARNRLTSPARKGRTSARDGDEVSTSSASNKARNSMQKPKIRALSPVRENSDPPESPGSLSLKLRRKGEQVKRSLSFTVKQNTYNSIEDDALESVEISKKKKKSRSVNSKSKKFNERSRSASPARTGMVSKQDNDESSASSALNRAKTSIRKPKSRSLSPVREKMDPPQPPGSLSSRLRTKREQIKRSLSFTAKQNVETDSAERSKNTNVPKRRSLSPKSKELEVDDSSVNEKRNGSSSPNRGMGNGRSARIDFTGTVIEMDEDPSEHSQLTTSGSVHIDVDGNPKTRRQSLHTIRSHEGGDGDEDDKHHTSTLSFAEEAPISSFAFGDRPLDSAQFSIVDTSELGSDLGEHIQKSRSRDTENSTPWIEDDDSAMARPSFKHLNPDSDGKKSVRPAAFKDGRSADFPEDTKNQKFLRYMYILPPNNNESQRERRIRALTWCSLICDFLAALVSVTTFNTVNTCCGVPILSTIARTDWDVIIRVFAYLYISMIFLEVVPVVRHQLPFNLINPTLGFLVTFAVFFDDDIAEAVVMWVIEVIAIICELVVYRLKRKFYQEKEETIKDAEEEIQQIKVKMKDRRRKMKKLREAFPGTYQNRVVKRMDMENGSYPGPPITPTGPKSSATIGLSTRSADSSRSPFRKVSNSPKRKVSGSTMAFSVGSRSATSSLSPVRTISNSSKGISSRSPRRERLENDSLGSLSPVREPSHPRKNRDASLSQLLRGSSNSMAHENNSETPSVSPKRRVSRRIQRNPSVRRGSSGDFSTGNRSTGSSQGRSARSAPRVGRSPVRRPPSSIDAMYASSDTMRVPIGSDDHECSNSFSLTYGEEELEAHRQEHRLDDKEEMRKLVQVRRWKKEQEKDLQHLGYLMFGVVYNVLLVMVTLIFMSVIAKNRGLCIVDMTAPAIFESGQLERCSNSKCSGSEQCEFCAGDPQFGEDDVERCYYPWY